jgi:3-deoxy-manno-octulosonate cytidylyltransferase (CMP-KDO synthetase)
MKVLIGIPARYGSTRFPGKPLIDIRGKEMLLRVWKNAQHAASKFEDGMVKCAVATEDQRILDFCKEKNIDCYMTSEACETGTDRILDLVKVMGVSPEFVVNLQGDLPLCPPWFVEQMVQAYLNDPKLDVVTPVVNLTWDGVEKLRKDKETTPFSGTCAVVALPKGENMMSPILENTEFDSIWFSKNIIPALRKADKMKALSPIYSPVLRHIGLYGYTLKVLKQLDDFEETVYGNLCEGLEQLKFLENGFKVKVVKVDYRSYKGMSGVDSPEDLSRAEAIIDECGELLDVA